MALPVPSDEATRLVCFNALLHPNYSVQANNLGTRYLSLLTQVLTRRAELNVHSWEAYRQTTNGR